MHVTEQPKLVNGGGIGALGLLGIVLVLLKLIGLIDWPWGLVTAPFWGVALAIVAIITLVDIFVFVTDLYRRRG